MSADDDRAAFEKWAEGEGYHLDPDIDCPGEYENVATRDAWVAWQAAIAAEREACAEVCRARARRFRHGAGAPSDGIVEAVEREARDCAAAIRARGAS